MYYFSGSFFFLSVTISGWKFEIPFFHFTSDLSEDNCETNMTFNGYIPLLKSYMRKDILKVKQFKDIF